MMGEFDECGDWCGLGLRQGSITKARGAVIGLTKRGLPSIVLEKHHHLVIFGCMYNSVAEGPAGTVMVILIHLRNGQVITLPLKTTLAQPGDKTRAMTGLAWGPDRLAEIRCTYHVA